MSFASSNLKLLIVAGIVLLIALIAVTAFAWSNSASKTIALATAALWSAAAFWALQLFLELRASENTDVISVEFTIDRSESRLWGNQGVADMRHPYEQGASGWLEHFSPDVFYGDRTLLSRHFALAEILLFFSWQEPDWRVTATTLRGSRYSTTQTLFSPVSGGGNCTEVHLADFAAALKNAGNVLAHYGLAYDESAPDKPLPFLDRPICFPPDTRMTLTNKALTLSNPFGSLAFTVVSSAGVVSLNPERNEPSPTLSSGEPRFETRLLGIRVVNHQNALYSQHRDAAKQAAWRERVIEGLHSWFEPSR
jgi:hypothetical protein